MKENERTHGQDKIERYRWQPIDKKGEFIWLKKEELYIDPLYQRLKINMNRVTEFSSTWSWIECGVLVVAIREGKWWIVDGGHRKLAADRRSDIQELPCMVFDSSSQATEARAFYDIAMHKTSLNGYDKFRALVVAGDETAIGLNDLMKLRGYVAGNTSDVKTIRCILTLWKLYRQNTKIVKDLWFLIVDVNKNCQIKDLFLRALINTEVVARQAGLSLLKRQAQEYLVALGGEMINAELAKERHIVGSGGYRVEANALIKLINKSRTIKIPLME